MVMNLMAEYRNYDEQDLVSDLIEEAIDQRGANVHYILRDMLNADYLLGEASMSDFKEFYQIPMFIESVEHFNGNGDVFDSLGISYTDSSIFQVGSNRFKKIVSEPANIVRPREGDLIYLPFSDSLWEITKVKMDLKYYQTGKNHSYRLVCKLFSYSHETIETNTETNFNNLGTTQDLDDSNIKKLLGISDNQLLDESDVFEEELTKSTVSPSSDTFGF
jgi:hypothetical protein